MSPDDVLAVLEALAAVPVWIDGGWGVDALIGRQTRPHADLDLVVAACAGARAERALAPLGYRHDPAVTPGLPARLVLRAADGRQVDVHPVAFDPAGNAWQDLGHGLRGAYPAAGLAGRGRIAGREVRCLTAALQWRHHQGYTPDAADRHDLDLLTRLMART